MYYEKGIRNDRLNLWQPILALIAVRTNHELVRDLGLIALTGKFWIVYMKNMYIIVVVKFSAAKTMVAVARNVSEYSATKVYVCRKIHLYSSQLAYPTIAESWQCVAIYVTTS